MRKSLGKLNYDQLRRTLIGQIAERKAAESSLANANRYLALIRSILRRARDDWEWIDHIPMVRLYREPRRRIRFLSRDEVRRLLQELPTHLREMAQFALMTGLRQRNVSFLRWDQIDMARGVAWIHPDQAKAGRPIGVLLNAGALEVLRRRRGEHLEYVFTYNSYNGKPVDRCSTYAFKKALARRDRARVSLARSAAYVGIVARAERDAVAGVDGAGQLVELRGDVALCASRGGPPA